MVVTGIEIDGDRGTWRVLFGKPSEPDTKPDDTPQRIIKNL
jgi:hypothetical protein